MKRLLIAILAVTALTACGKKSGNAANETPDYHPRRMPDSISEKYTKALLTCSMWLKPSHVVGSYPDDTFSIDLLNPNEAIGARIRMQANTVSSWAYATIEVKNISIVENVTVMNPRIRTRYHLHNSITANISYHYKSQIDDGSGLYISTESRATSTLVFEKAPLVITDHTAYRINERMECILETQVRPEFRGDVVTEGY